jgi:hypothetical protein
MLDGRAYRAADRAHRLPGPVAVRHEDAERPTGGFGEVNRDGFERPRGSLGQVFVRIRILMQISDFIY